MVVLASTTVSPTREDRVGFPSFLPPQVHNIRDPKAIQMATRIQRIPVQTNLLTNSIMSSCVKPLQRTDNDPVVLLHGFDSSCLEWRYAYPLLENTGMEAWAIDILGWGFSDLESRPPCDVTGKREHLYQFWRMYIKRPMVLVGPSLGAAVAIDFAAFHSEAVKKLILIDASIYAEGTGKLSELPKAVAYAGVGVLKSIPLRFYANTLVFNNIPLDINYDRMRVGRLHCLQPWWEDAMVDFMLSGGYNVVSQIQKTKQETLIIWGMEDTIINSSFALKLQDDLPNSVLHKIPECGHLPHIDNPEAVTKLVFDFVNH